MCLLRNENGKDWKMLQVELYHEFFCRKVGKLFIHVIKRGTLFSPYIFISEVILLDVLS